jgi:hypothetical protein
MSELHSLETIRGFILERVKLGGYFADIPVLDERKGDLLSQVEMAIGVVSGLGGRCGVCLVMLAFVASDTNRNVPSGELSVEVGFLVLENPMMNDDPIGGIGKKALVVYEELRQELKHFCVAGSFIGLVPAEQDLVPVDRGMAPVEYEVRFRTRQAATTVVPKVDVPVFTVGVSTVTITCGTAAAQIWYTVDGSYPSPNNNLAALYATAFTKPAADTVVLAIAYKDGYVASNGAMVRI